MFFFFCVRLQPYLVTDYFFYHLCLIPYLKYNTLFVFEYKYISNTTTNYHKHEKGA